MVMVVVSWLLMVVAVVGVVITDLTLKWVTRRWAALLGMVVAPHAVLIAHFTYVSLGSRGIPLVAFTVFYALWFFARLAFYLTPCRIQVSLRVRIMMGGRRIVLATLLSSLSQIPLCIAVWLHHEALALSTNWTIADIVVTWLLLLMFALNGVARILFTSRRLGLSKRVLFLIFVWVPVVNFIMGVWFCRIVKLEFARAVQQAELQSVRESSEVCRTRYPLLMLHGIGFRDYKYINYWGRIPALLIENGATVYYGHQQAWGTIEDNAKEIKAKLESILEETGCEKVNIIAHSKGGLDARYLISSLHMDAHVATLTTISTPHRGSELIDVLAKLKKSTYKRISKTIDGYFKKLGDTNPNCYTASRQLKPSYLEGFNRENADAQGVYYQSWAAEMKAPTSHSLLMLPFAIMKWVSGNNDGLVTTDSAKWGHFRGTFTSRTHRGISHGDLIDLMHQDFEGFNIAEEYVTIVSELKEKGY
jgi:triacylglycerol lipase